MTVFSRMVIPLLVILALALGAETYTRMRIAEDLRQQIHSLSGQVSRAESTANEAAAAAKEAAKQAAIAADQARASAAEVDKIASQASSQAALQKNAAPPVGPDMLTGKALATLVCAACHIVSSDQPTEPVLRPPAPDFRDIARRPGTTDAGLREFLARPHGAHEKMPGQYLLDSQVTLLADYIMSLRNQPAR